MRRRTSAIAALFLVGALSNACQPKDERPGLWLSGQSAGSVQDWRFTEDVEEVFIETTPWYGVRHSTTIWCVDLDGELYIGSYTEDDVKYWEEIVASNPEARLRIEDRIYEVSVAPVESDELAKRLDDRYAEKYDMAEVFGDDLPLWRYYSVRLRGEQGANLMAAPPAVALAGGARHGAD